MSIGIFMPPPAPLMTGGGGGETGFFTLDSVTMQEFQIVPVDQQSGIMVIAVANGIIVSYADGNVYGAETTMEFLGNTGFFLGVSGEGVGSYAFYVFPLDGTYPTGTPDQFGPGPNITVTDNGTPIVYDSYVSLGTVKTFVGAVATDPSFNPPPSNYVLGNVIQSPGFEIGGLVWEEGNPNQTQINIVNGEFPDIIFEFNGDTISGEQWVSTSDGQTYITIDAEFYSTWPTSGTHPFTLRLP